MYLMFFLKKGGVIMDAFEIWTRLQNLRIKNKDDEISNWSENDKKEFQKLHELAAEMSFEDFLNEFRKRS